MSGGPPSRVIIDTDPGIDDALALILALRSPELQVEAITTVSGNVSGEQALTNALRVLEVLDLPNPPPVAAGCDRPLVREPIAARHVHGEDGLGDISGLVEADGAARYPTPTLTAVGKHAVDLIVDLVRSNPGLLTIIALGPLTNVASAFEKDPDAIRGVKRIVAMGGSVSGVGNVTPVAEFNFHHDPHAAAQVLGSGAEVTIVGLDVTTKTLLTRAALENRLRDTGDRPRGAGGRVSRFIGDVSEKYFEVNETRRGLAGCPLHDPLAVGVAIDASFTELRAFDADVETEGRLTAGMLVADRRIGAGVNTGTIRAAVDVDAGRFVEFFLTRVTP